MIGIFAANLVQAKAKAAEVGIEPGNHCEEASPRSKETYIACGRQAEALIWHSKDKRLYYMCRACANHNIKNRDGVMILTTSPLLRGHLTRG